jgi:hypothetical protein
MQTRVQRAAVPAGAAHKSAAPAPHSGLPDTEPSRVLRQLLGSGVIQAKLTVSQPGDPLEQRASR